MPPTAIRHVALIALMLAVCTVAFEATTRLDDWVRFGTPLSSPIAVEEDLLVRDALGEHGRPHAQFQKWTLNNVGMRGPDVALIKPPGRLRVVTAGASETFGLYESPRGEYPRQLEDSLRAELETDRCGRSGVEVLNAAIFGMTLPSVEQDLRTRVQPLHPDVVVLYPTPVQYLADIVPEAAPPTDSAPHDADEEYAFFRPRGASELRNQLREILPQWSKTWLRQRDIDEAVESRPRDWRFTSLPSDRLALYDRDLRRAIGTIRAIRAVPVVMTHANVFMTASGAGDAAQLTAWERFYPRASGRIIMAFDSAADEMTLRAARDSAAPVVDLAAIIRRVPPDLGKQIFRDYAHFSDVGSALVAGALAPAVWRACQGR